MIKVIEKDKCFGIIENGKEVVPFLHPTKENAIEEWVYFQKSNVKRQFLNYKRTIEEIDEITFYLTNSNYYKMTNEEELSESLSYAQDLIQELKVLKQDIIARDEQIARLEKELNDCNEAYLDCFNHGNKL